MIVFYGIVESLFKASVILKEFELYESALLELCKKSLRSNMT